MNPPGRCLLRPGPVELLGRSKQRPYDSSTRATWQKFSGLGYDAAGAVENRSLHT